MPMNGDDSMLMVGTQASFIYVSATEVQMRPSDRGYHARLWEFH